MRTALERLGAGTVDYCIRHGRIVAAPLAFMRGKTFNNRTFVILDEAQNTTVAQMKMFLTRFGQNSRIVVCGDPDRNRVMVLWGGYVKPVTQKIEFG